MNIQEKLTSRQNQIIKYLYSHSDALSSDFLSTSIGVSTKTIKKEIKEIMPIVLENGAMIISKTGTGYSLQIFDNQLFEEFLNYNHENQSEISNLPFIYQRAHYIIRRILSSNGNVTINQLSDELYTSRTTINSDLILVKELLKTYSLKLISKPHHGLSYQGKEIHVRFCLIDEYQYFEVNTLFVEELEYYSLFNASNKLIDGIKEIIYEEQRTHETLEISYNHIIILVRMILLCNSRKNYSHQILFEDDELYRIKTKPAYNIARKILKSSQNLLEASFSINDYCTLAIAIFCYQNYSSPDKVINRETYYKRYQLAEDIINFLCENNQFILLDGDVTLTSSLALHLIPLINRCRFHVKLSNIDAISIKQNSISSIELATQTAYYLKKHYQLVLPQDEIVFLAMVFHPTFGRYNRNTKPKNIIIVNSIDKNVGKGIAERLSRNFEERIGMIKICDYYELKNINYHDYDLLVSDIDLQSLAMIPIPILKLDAFFKQAIKGDLKDILSMRKFDFETMINNFKPELFFTYQTIENKESFFEAYYYNLQSQSPIAKNFIEQLRLRDQLCSCEDGNKVAFMKTISSLSTQTFISVNILDKAITWQYESVQVIIIAHIGEKDYINAEFFENGYFGNIIKSTFFKQENVMKLMKNPNFDTMSQLVKQRVCTPFFYPAKNKVN